MTEDNWSNRSVVVRGAAHAGNRGGTDAPTVVVVAAAAGNSTLRGVVQPYSAVSRDSMIPYHSATPSATSLLPASIGGLLVPSSDISHTYWIPQRERHEVGLLEALHRRTAANTSYMLVSSRPQEELQRNFSDAAGCCVNLDVDLFKLSKTHIALHQMERNVHDDVTLDGRSLKSGMREQLPQLQHDDYYLVRYRDYSDWAVSTLKPQTKRDSLFGPKYVEQCFAVRVGQGPGVFIPITEPQFLFGNEILDRQRLTVSPAQVASRAVNLFALNADQMKSIETIDLSSHAQPQPHSHGTAAAAAYVPPSKWDWTPSAIEKRVNHFLEEQYRSVGRMVVKGALVAVAMYFFVQFVRQGTGLNNSIPDRNQQATSSRRQARRSSQRYEDDINTGGSVVGSVLRGVFFTGPKEVFDFLLGGGGQQQQLRR